MTEPYDQFTLSSTLTDRLRRSGSRASVPVQLAAAIPQPLAQTQASPSPQMTVLEYTTEVMKDGAVAYWFLGPDYQYPGYEGDATLLGEVLPHFTPTHFYGYVAPLVGAYTPVNGGGATPSDPRNDAISFGAADGLTITYFPLVGLESFFSGSLGFAVAADFYWEFWVRTTQAPAGAVRLVEQSSGGVFPYLVQLTPTGKVRASRSDGTLTATVDSTEAVNDGSWHYVAVYKSGSSFAVAIGTNAAATTTDTLTGDTMLTVDGLVAGDGYVGDMDELALYPAALTLAQRQRRAAAAAGTPVPA